jgi:hypothetical protein
MAAESNPGQIPDPRNGREFLSPYEDHPGLPAAVVPYWNMLMWKEDAVAALATPYEGPHYAANVLLRAQAELDEARTAYLAEMAFYTEAPAMAA